MNPEETAQEIINSELFPVTVERSIVHNKRIAPKGCAFFIVKGKSKARAYTLSQLVKTQGLSDEQEEEVKKYLKGRMIDHLKHN